MSPASGSMTHIYIYEGLGFRDGGLGFLHVEGFRTRSGMSFSEDPNSPMQAILIDF